MPTWVSRTAGLVDGQPELVDLPITEIVEQLFVDEQTDRVLDLTSAILSPRRQVMSSPV